MNPILSIIILILLFLVLGVAIGGFGTLLFVRFDADWKRVILGIAAFILTGESGKILVEYLQLGKDKIPLYLLMMLIGIIASTYFVFIKVCDQLKKQSGVASIRILDIVLGYSSYLDQYYSERKKEIEKQIDKEYNFTELEKQKAYVEAKTKQLEVIQSNIEEQKKGALILKLPENGEYPITDRFIRQIPMYVNRICEFYNAIDHLTEETCEKLDNPNSDKSIILRGYFVGIGICISEALFATHSKDIRTHFRIRKDDKYCQYTVVTGNEISTEDIHDIPVGSYMIERSFALKKSLVASINSEIIYDVNTLWDDFMTITYYNLSMDDKPFFSMGISIKYAEQYQDMLYFINYYKIEECLHKYIGLVNKKCDIVDTLK